MVPVQLVLSSIVKVARMWPDLTAQFSQLLADVLTSCKRELSYMLLYPVKDCSALCTSNVSS